MVVHGPYPLGEPRVEREALAARAAGWQVEVLAMRRVGEAAEEQVDGVLVRRLPIEHRRGAGFAAALREYIGFTAWPRYGWHGGLPRSGSRPRSARLPNRRSLRATAPRSAGDSRHPRPFLGHVRDAIQRPFGAGAADVLLRIFERVGRGRQTQSSRCTSLTERARAARRCDTKVAVLLNSVDESRLPAVGRDGSSADGFRIVYHGTITPHYGVDLLVRGGGPAARG